MKKILAMVLALVMVLGLASCGLVGKEAPVEEKPAASTTTPAAPSTSGDAAAAERPVYTNSTETQGKSNEIVIKFSHGAAETAPPVKAALSTFAPEVEFNSNGRIGVEIYSGGQVGDDTTATEMLIAGQLEMVNPSTAPLVGYVPELGIFDIPFLFNDEAEADAICGGEVGEYLDAKLEAKGLINLAWNENGFRELTNSKREVASVADVAGLKIRTMENEFHEELWNSLGANATPMSSSELYTALEQGTVDGEENPVANLYAYQFQEVQDYITFTNHIYSPFLCLFSKQIWDTYDADAQTVVADAAEKYGVEEKAINRADAGVCLQSCIDDYGMTVTYLDDAAKAEFVEKTAHIQDMVAEETGTEIMELLNAAKAAYKG